MVTCCVYRARRGTGSKSNVTSQVKDLMVRKTVLLFAAHLIFCCAAVADDEAKLALVATQDGRPSPLMSQFLTDREDTLENVANRDVDIIYGRKDGVALTMDIYRPLRDRNNRGIILVVSQGFWSGPEYRRMPKLTAKIRTLVEHGFTVFAVIHGSQPRYAIDEIMGDIQRSIRFVRHRHDQFDIDSQSIGIFGDSSGGHLALLAATLPPKDVPAPRDAADTKSSTVQAAVAYYPNTDLKNYGAEKRLIQEHFRGKGLAMAGVFDFRRWDAQSGKLTSMSAQEKLTALLDLSPVSHVSKLAAPTLLIHGEKDDLVPIQQSHLFLRNMQKAGAECSLFVAPGMGHGWDKPVAGETEFLVTWLRKHLSTESN